MFLKITGEDNLVQGGNLLWTEILKITALFFCLIMHHLISVNSMRSETGLQPAKKKKALKKLPWARERWPLKTVTPENSVTKTQSANLVITEIFALSPDETSSWAEGSCWTFCSYSFVPPPHCTNGIAAHAWKFLWYISKPMYDCNQDNTMAASGIKRKPRTKYQNFSLQRSSLKNSKQEGVMNHLVHLQRSTKQNLLYPASMFNVWYVS